MPLPKKPRSGTRSNDNHVTPSADKQATRTAGENNSGASPMHAERLKKLYAAMLKCRMMDNLIRAHVEDRRSCRRREAIISGAAIHLGPEDLIAPASGEFFARLVQGASLETGLSSVKQETNVDTAGTGIQNTAARTASAQLNIAAGMALACKLQSRPSVTLCIVDEPGHSPASWHEPLNFAASRRLAIVFVIVNAASSAQEQAVDLRGEVQQFVPAITVDGADAVAVYRVAEECTRRARQGLGPSLIECCIGDGPDPVLFMENYLKQRNLWSETWKENLVRELGRALESAAKKHFGRARRGMGLASELL